MKVRFIRHTPYRRNESDLRLALASLKTALVISSFGLLIPAFSNATPPIAPRCFQDYSMIAVGADEPTVFAIPIHPSHPYNEELARRNAQLDPRTRATPEPTKGAMASFAALKLEMVRISNRAEELLRLLQDQGFVDPRLRQELERELSSLIRRNKEILAEVSEVHAQFKRRGTKNPEPEVTRDSEGNLQIKYVFEDEVIVRRLYADPEAILAIERDSQVHSLVGFAYEEYAKLLGKIDSEARVLLGLVKNFPEQPKFWRAIKGMRPDQIRSFMAELKSSDSRFRYWSTVGIEPFEILARILNSPKPIRKRAHWAAGYDEIYDSVSGIGVRFNRDGTIDRFVALPSEELAGLPRNSVDRLPGEADQAGIQWLADTKIQRNTDGNLVRTQPGNLGNGDLMPDGKYIYLIDKRGQVIVSPREVNLSEGPDGKILATHRALYKRLELRRQGIEILAAGEFELFGGSMVELNNRAGTFYGGPLQLHIAEDRFRRFGIPFHDNARMVEYSTAPPNASPHETAMQAAQTIARVLRDPALRKPYDKFKEFYRLLALRAPHKDRAGAIKFLEIFDMQKLKAIDDGKHYDAFMGPDGQGFEDYLQFLSLAGIIEGDGLAFAIRGATLRDAGAKPLYEAMGFDSVDALMDNFIRTFQRMEAAREAAGLGRALTDAEYRRILAM